MDPLLFWAIWGAGILPAVYVAGKRYDAWEQGGYSSDALVGLAPMFWPLWLIIAILIQLGRPVAFVIALIFELGRRRPTPPAETP